MSFKHITAVRPSALPRIGFWKPLSYLILGVVALLLRVVDLGGFVTVDEVNYWIGRSEIFLRALGTGDYAATAITPHPGVTTMWLGSAGIILRRELFAWGLLQDGSFATTLALLRLPAALTHVAGILLGYKLLRRLFPEAVATLAAFLWATDPFVIGFSRVLHVDALASTFLTLSLLAACLYWHHDPRRRWLLLSGVCAGLAILSKSPAAILLPGVTLIALAAAWRQDKPPRTNDEETPSRPGRKCTNGLDAKRRRGEEAMILASSPHASSPQTIGLCRPTCIRSFVLRPSSFVPLLAWGAITATTICALWPALWVDPLRAYAVLQQALDLATQPHDRGNFFLGREDADPGLLFYPVALALRMTSLTLLGLLLLAWRRAWLLASSRRDLAALACFVILFVVALSFSPKKFNRYLVPCMPVVDIIAAAGLATLNVQLWRRNAVTQARIAQWSDSIRAVLLSIFLLGAIINTARWHPYEIAYYNPVLGGAQAGADTFLTGWGEGMEQVAAWLNQQPDITGVVTASTATVTLRPYMRHGAQAETPDGELPEDTGYVVVDIRHVQQGHLWSPFDQFYGRATPLHVVRIHDVEYAWIYQASPPVQYPRAANFGPAIQLRGFNLDGALRRGADLTFRLVWQARDQIANDHTLFAHLLGPDGRMYAQADIPYPTGQWRPGRFVTTELPLRLPNDAPSGAYRLFIGLYDPASGQRLPLADPEQYGSALDGPAALPLYQAAVN